tara:strand:+ start:247 stop:471 length:225 start_codon:yes stop_codon:yes gene_type:complete
LEEIIYLAKKMVRLFDDDDLEDCYDLFKEQIIPLLDATDNIIVKQFLQLQDYFTNEEWVLAMEQMEVIRKTVHE